MTEPRPAMPDEVPEWFREPTLWQRLAGGLIDGLIAALASGLLFVVAVLVSTSPSDPDYDGWWLTLALAVLRFAYTVGFTVSSGQTIGKQIMGTRVVGLEDGQLVPFGPAAMRWLVSDGFVVALSASIDALAGLSLLVTLVVLGPILSPPLHRGLHDRAAGTVVTASRAGVLLRRGGPRR